MVSSVRSASSISAPSSESSSTYLTASNFPKNKHFTIISYEASDSQIPFFFGHIYQLNEQSHNGFITFDEPNEAHVVPQSQIKKKHQVIQIPFDFEDFIKYDTESLSPQLHSFVIFSVIETPMQQRKACNIRLISPAAYADLKLFFRNQHEVNLICRKIEKLENQYKAKMPSLEKSAAKLFAVVHEPQSALKQHEEFEDDDTDVFLETAATSADIYLADDDNIEVVENIINTLVKDHQEHQKEQKAAKKDAKKDRKGVKELSSVQTIETTTATTVPIAALERAAAKKPRRKRTHVDLVYPPSMEIQPRLNFLAAMDAIRKALEEHRYADAMRTLVENVRLRDADPDFLVTKFSPLFASVVENKFEPELIFKFLQYVYACMNAASTRTENSRFLDVLVELILYCTRFLYTREYRVRTRIVAKTITEMPNVVREEYAHHALYLLTNNYRNFTFNYEGLRRIERFLSGVSVSLPMHSHFLLRQYAPVKGRMEEVEQQWFEYNADRSAKHPVPAPKEIMRFGASSAAVPDSEDRASSIAGLFSDATFDKETLSKDILALISKLEPSKEEVTAKDEAVHDMQDVVRKTLGPSAELHMYGSSASGFGMRGCDVDLCLTVNDSTDDQNDNKVQANILHILQSRLERKARKEKHLVLKQAVSKSRVPILKLENTQKHVDMDICMGTTLGVANTKLLREYASIHHRVRELIYIVKHWAKTRKISDAASGSLSSYSYVLLTIAYLQELGVLPSLQELVNHPDCKPEDISSPRFINAFNTQFFVNLPKLYTMWKSKVDIGSFTIAELFYGFFKYYCQIFNKAEWVASVRFAAPLKKAWPSPLSIEDPFELRDLGTVITEQKAPLIEKEFQRAFKLLSDGAPLHEIIKPPLHEVDDTNIYAQKRPKYEAHEDVKRVKQLIADGHVFQGVLRVNARRFFEAYVTVEGFRKDIYIDGLNPRNRALHGDLVAIKVHNRDDNDQSDQHSGEVLSIIQRKAPLLYACTIMDQQRPSHCHWMLPLEKTFPKIMVEFYDFIEKYNVKGDELGDYIFVVRLDPTWKENSRYPHGHVVGTLGLRRDLWAQKRAVFLQQMPQLYEQLYGKTSAMDDAEERKNDVHIHTTPLQVEHDTSMDHLYQDWTDRRIFTIDPSQSRDLDDALSIEALPDNKYKIGVYIADVTRFLSEGNIHDNDARERCTSVYMIDMVEHMLNPQLSQDQASILPNVPRYSVAVEWVMHETGKVDFDTVQFAKGSIVSCCRLDYDTVQEILEGKDKAITVSHPHTKESIVNDIHIMNKIAQNLRGRRYNSGAVALGSSDLDFELDDAGYPIGVKRPVHNESHQLIEEFMLMANQLTAITLHNEFGDEAVQRRHEAPDEAGLMRTVLQYGRALNRLIAQSPLPNAGDLMFGTEEVETALVRIQTGEENNFSSLTAMNKLIAATDRFKDIQSCVKHIMLREMNIGKYAREGDCKRAKDKKGVHHFALNMKYYTHFTSPIRRYADVLVHRQIMELILAKHESRPVRAPLAGKELSNMIEKINDQSIRAKNIQEQLNRLYLTHLVAKQIREGHLIRKKATIMSLGRRSFTVFIEEYGAEIQCNLMKDLKNTPSFVSSGDVEPDEAVDLSGEVEFVNVLWTDPADQRIHTKEMQLYAFKTLYVDLWADFGKIPATLVIYDLWDYNDEKDGTPAPRTIKLAPPERTFTTHKEMRDKKQKSPSVNSLDDSVVAHATLQRDGPIRGEHSRRGGKQFPNRNRDREFDRENSPRARRLDDTNSHASRRHRGDDGNGDGERRRTRGGSSNRGDDCRGDDRRGRDRAGGRRNGDRRGADEHEDRVETTQPSSVGMDFASAFMAVNVGAVPQEDNLSRHSSESNDKPQKRSYRSNGFYKRGGGRGGRGRGGRGSSSGRGGREL